MSKGKITEKCYSRLLPLKKLIKDEEILNLIHRTAVNTNNIITHTYHLVKLFVLKIFKDRKDDPKNTLDWNKIFPIDRSFLKLAMALLSNSKGGKIENTYLINTLKSFYSSEYAPLVPFKIDRVPKDLLDQEIIQMIAAIETHITTHFYTYIRKLASSHVDKKTKKKYTVINQLTRDLYHNTKKSEEKYHSLIDDFAPLIVEARQTLKSNPQAHLYLLYLINCKIEDIGKRPLALLPTRENMVPANITLSKTIATPLFGPLKSIEPVWDSITSAVKETFKIKPGYDFSSLKTDGIGCSVLFKSKTKSFVVELTEKYVDELTSTEKSKYSKYNIVGADPNKGNLLMMVDDRGDTMRFTNNQFKRECGVRKYRAIRLKRDSGILCGTDTKNIFLTEAIAKLAMLKSKTMNYDEYKNFVREKNIVQYNFNEYYCAGWHRKFKFNAKINKKRSIDNFINRFSDKYGPPESTILCVGDWEQRKGISFGKEPTIGVGVRSWFRHRGYKVFLVDEYNSSKSCSKCHCNDPECKVEYNWKKRQDPRPSREGHEQKVWGLIRCKNSQCLAVDNRDVNSGKNLHTIARSHIRGLSIPTCFNRTKIHTNAVDNSRAN